MTAPTRPLKSITNVLIRENGVNDGLTLEGWRCHEERQGSFANVPGLLLWQVQL